MWVRPVIELVNDPAPVPSEVLDPAVDSAPEVADQQTPREVTLAPPSEVIFPPEVAVV